MHCCPLLIPAAWSQRQVSFKQSGVCIACLEDAYMFAVVQVLRLLLGFFEAGALPGMWAMLAHFYSKERITMPLGWLMGALIVSQALGAPIAALLMLLDGHGGLRGWQW